MLMAHGIRPMCIVNRSLPSKKLSLMAREHNRIHDEDDHLKGEICARDEYFEFSVQFKAKQKVNKETEKNVWETLAGLYTFLMLSVKTFDRYPFGIT